MMTSLAEYNTKFQQIAKSSEILAEEFKLKCDQEVELRDELEQIRAEFEEMVALKENEFCNLKENYQLVENEVSELKNEVETLEEEQVVSKNVISELAQNLSICNNQIIQLEKELGDSEEAMKAVAAFSEEKEQQLEEKIAQQELESLRALKSTNDLVKSNEGLAVIVQDLQRDVEAKEKCLKQQKEDAEMRLSYFRSELEEVTTSSAKEIVELKSKLTEKVKESLRHNEKNQFFEEVGAQMRRRVMDLEHENNKIEIQMKEKMIASGAAHRRLNNQLIELETSKSKELEEIKRKAADTQAQLEREMKHVKSVNDKKTEMNTTLQRQLREMSSHMQQLTDNLLKLSSQHEKFVDLATSHGVSFDLMAGSNK
jgi:chromosome segregation protein